MTGWEDLLDEAEGLWQEGRHHDALQACDRAALQGEDARYYAAIMRGDILLELGDAPGALSSFESVADPDVADPDVDLSRGVALFELGRFAEAENALRSAQRGDANLAEAHYTLGLIAELQGTGAEAEHFRQARKLDAELYAPRPQIGREEFEKIVEEALESLPDRVAGVVRNVPVLVAELPHPDDLRLADPPLSPRSLGLFVGLPPRAISSLDAPAIEQPTILLFKRNLERACRDRDELVREVNLTVVHEVGHALGLSEEDLEERGLQ
ncbi:MAG: metallopeptidase family protein [Clostridia bacterium]|nr:metallopeptidase family protein [Deltaproteobacteria bacterium]